MAALVKVEGLGRAPSYGCPRCGTQFQRTLVRFDFRRTFFGYFPADRCRKGHVFFTPESSGAIQTMAKAKGLCGTPRRRARRKGRKGARSPHPRKAS